ncbi:MAG: methionyl-tRNA formyltransferase [Candidatus Eisenbacteria bacterium]
MRLAFLGTPDFAATVLRALLASRHTVAGVICQPSRPSGRGLAVEEPAVARVAREAGLPLLQPAKLLLPETLDSLRALEAELFVTAAYGRILKRAWLDLPPRGCWNVHGSVLPRHRGASPVAASILAGDAWTGITIFQMDEGMDTGAILSEAMTPIGARETTGELMLRLAAMGGDLLVRTLDRAERGELDPIEQSPDGATYAGMLEKEDGLLKTHLPVEQIDRQIRAMTPWPGAFAFVGGQRLRVHRATPLDRIPRTELHGTLLPRDDGVGLVCAPGLLLLEEVQLDGRKRTAAREWWRGARLSPGTRLTGAPTTGA